MRKPENDTIKFFAWTSLAVVAGGGLIASAWPSIITSAHAQSATLVAMGDKSTGANASLNYRLADALDHTNQVAAQHYANDLMARGDAIRAAKVIKRSGGLSTNAVSAEIYTRAELEIGSSTDITTALAHLKPLATTDDQIVTVALASAVVGERSDTITALERHVSSPEALQRVRQAASGNVALADALSISGLVQSSQRVLNSLPTSAPRDLRLAKLEANSDQKTIWLLAANHFESYLLVMPADSSVRLQYASVLDRLKEPSAAGTQRSLAVKIEAGQP
ncbi:hypothetical protein HJC99_01340 [Candidatus Saccharibacteria bacterium]|nr:hypothetical protein [Candidatus Saccharibacteria bacterium]